MENEFKEEKPFSTKNIFTVPDGYFKQLEMQIHQQTRKKESFLLVILQSKALKLAFAAACVVVTIFLWPTENISNPEQLLASVSDEQLIRYLEENSLPESDDILTYEELSLEEISTLELNTNNDSIL